MARLMSVQLTEQAVVERRKTQTRRLGWLHVKVGDELRLVRKAMGRSRRLADGSRVVEPLVDVARVRVTDVRREPLDAITDEEVLLEGFTMDDLTEYAAPLGDSLAQRFVLFFSRHMRCGGATVVTVITWEYLP